METLSVMPEIVVAIDPGDQTSAAVWLEVSSFKPLEIFDGANCELRSMILGLGHRNPRAILAVEYTPPYTMSTANNHNYVPRQVVDTAIEIGRSLECWRNDDTAELISRSDIKKHLLGRTAGNDTAVRAAVVDRYGDKPKGTKKAPGPLYGFAGTHLYSALAVGIAWLETHGFNAPSKLAGRVF